MNSIDLNQVRIFTQVVAAGSFTRAAALTGQPKSTLSRKIAQLERRLGVRLLHRTTRTFKPTEVGSAYYERCRSILSELQEAEGAVTTLHGKVQGLLRITASVEFGTTYLSPIVREFMHRNPEISVEMMLTNRVVDLIDESIDLAIRMGNLEDSAALVARKVAGHRLHLYASPKYLKENGIPKTPQDLTRHSCIHFTGPSAEWSWVLERARSSTPERVQVPVHGRYSANHLTLVRDGAIAGFGIGLLHDAEAKAAVRAGQLKRVLSDWHSPEAPIHAVFPANRYLAPKVRAFVDFVALHLKKTGEG